MLSILQWTWNLIAAIAPALLTGPGAAIVYLRMLRQPAAPRWAWYWLGLLIVNGVTALFMGANLGNFLPGPGFFACALTPVGALLAALLLMRARSAFTAHSPQARWALVGAVLIPLIQIIVPLVIVVLLGPWMCQNGIRSCSD